MTAKTTPAKPPRARSDRGPRARRNPRKDINAERIAVAERRAAALNLRRQGYTYAQIADKMRAEHPGCPDWYDRSTAHGDVSDAFAAIITEPAEDVRRLELLRLDALLVVLAETAGKGELGAIDRILKIMERRSRLLGLDAPSRIEATGADGSPLMQPSDPEEARRLALEAVTEAQRRLRKP